MRTTKRILTTLIAAGLAAPGAGEVRVQDVAKLKGQRTNRLMGFGLVVGLDGTGDGREINTTRRALMALHRRFEQPVLDIDELDASSVALVSVEAQIPEFGAREGDTVDVVVATLNGKAESLRGGQLLVTPLQDTTMTIPAVLALAGGRIEIPNPEVPTRGIVRDGATIEQDFFYNFIQDGQITLVLDDVHAGWPMAQLVARAINQELSSPTLFGTGDETSLAEIEVDAATAVGPKNVRVRIPKAELPRPAWVISQILQTPLFVMPHQQARVFINRTTKKVSVTGAVTISPTVLLIPGLGSVTVGGGQDAPTTGAVALDTENTADVSLQQLMRTLTQMKLTGDQLIEAIEHLHRTGTLHAQLVYTE